MYFIILDILDIKLENLSILLASMPIQPTSFHTGLLFMDEVFWA